MANAEAARRVVIDASVVAAWTFKEADSPQAVRIEALVSAGQVTAVVPSLMWAEFQHICRRKWNVFGVPMEAVEASYQVVLNANLTEVPGELLAFRGAAWEWIKNLSIGSYDAYYLAMGIALGVEVWTFDRPFRDATLKDVRTAGRVKVPGEDVHL